MPSLPTPFSIFLHFPSHSSLVPPAYRPENRLLKSEVPCVAALRLHVHACMPAGLGGIHACRWEEILISLIGVMSLDILIEMGVMDCVCVPAFGCPTLPGFSTSPFLSLLCYSLLVQPAPPPTAWSIVFFLTISEPSDPSPPHPFFCPHLLPACHFSGGR